MVEKSPFSFPVYRILKVLNLTMTGTQKLEFGDVNLSIKFDASEAFAAGDSIMVQFPVWMADYLALSTLNIGLIRHGVNANGEPYTPIELKQPLVIGGSVVLTIATAQLDFKNTYRLYVKDFVLPAT